MTESFYRYHRIPFNLQQPFGLSFHNTRVIGIHDHIYFYKIICKPLKAAWLAREYEFRVESACPLAQLLWLVQDSNCSEGQRFVMMRGGPSTVPHLEPRRGTETLTCPLHSTPVLVSLPALVSLRITSHQKGAGFNF